MSGARFLAPALACAAFALFAALFLLDRPAYLAVLGAIHIHPRPRPFLDTRFVTATAECWRQGIDVYARDPCDPLGRTMDYSPLLLRLPFLAQPDAATPVLGLLVDLAFLASLFALPWPARGTWPGAAAVAATLSWSVALAAERGNIDLLIFAAAAAVARLSTGGPPARAAGLAIALLAGLAKFYPLVLLALLLRERRGVVLAGSALLAAVLAIFAVLFHAELARIGGNMAGALFGDMFGARTLPYGALLLLGGVPIRAPDGVYAGAGALGAALRPVAAVLLALCLAACGLAAACLAAVPAWRDAVRSLAPAERATLLVGALLAAGCFVAHQNIGYRAVLLLLALPGLLRLAADAPARTVRRVASTAALLVVLATWGGLLARSVPGWLLVATAWWPLVTVLLAAGIVLLLPARR